MNKPSPHTQNTETMKKKAELLLQLAYQRFSKSIRFAKKKTFHFVTHFNARDYIELK